MLIFISNDHIPHQIEANLTSSSPAKGYMHLYARPCTFDSVCVDTILRILKSKRMIHSMMRRIFFIDGAISFSAICMNYGIIGNAFLYIICQSFLGPIIHDNYFNSFLSHLFNHTEDPGTFNVVSSIVFPLPKF
jgi:hypothetical protein